MYNPKQVKFITNIGISNVRLNDTAKFSRYCK